MLLAVKNSEKIWVMTSLTIGLLPLVSHSRVFRFSLFTSLKRTANRLHQGFKLQL
jgi:hypothetical protein